MFLKIHLITMKSQKKMSILSAKVLFVHGSQLAVM
uniref:Uncharacterized protein n=1 Tax=Arundo donax TaxID=35708 RepID=A0A0A9FCB2_ARUDO